MASHTISGQAWPSGTVVSVYSANALPVSGDGTPVGVAITSATVSGSSVTFSGLSENVRYLAYAAGVGKRFLIPQQDPMDARSLRTRLDELEGDTLPAFEGTVVDGFSVPAPAAFAPVFVSQSAMVAATIAEATANGGGRVALKRGAAYTLEGIVVPSNVTFDFNRATVTHKAGSTLSCIQVTGTDAKVVNGTINGNATAVTGLVPAIQVTSARVEIAWLEIYDAKRHLVQITETASNVEVHHVRGRKVNETLACSDRGIYVYTPDNGVTRANRIHIHHCHVADTGAANISFTGDYVRVDHNLLERAGATGDGVAGYDALSTYVTVSDNEIHDPENHYVHIGGQHVTMQNNRGYNAGTEGYVVASAPNGNETASVGAMVSGNYGLTTRTLGGASGSLVRVQGYTNVTIDAGLSVSANLGGYNIVDCVDVTLYPGTVKGCGSHGIRIAGCVNVSINGGMSRNNVGSGIVLCNFTRPDTTVIETDTVEINGTLLKNNAGWGLVAQNSTARVTVNAPMRNNALGNISPMPNRTTNNVVPGKTDTPVSIASAATMVFPEDVGYYFVTGTTPITAIQTSWPGREITMVFQTGAANMVVDGGTLKLAGNFSPGSTSSMKVACDGANWYELSRSVN